MFWLRGTETGAAGLQVAYHNIITHNESKAKYTELLLSAASAHGVTIFSLSSSALPPRSSRLTFFKQTFACWVLRAKLKHGVGSVSWRARVDLAQDRTIEPPAVFGEGGEKLYVPDKRPNPKLRSRAGKSRMQAAGKLRFCR
jgi:hypothetical protein